MQFDSKSVSFAAAAVAAVLASPFAATAGPAPAPRMWSEGTSRRFNQVAAAERESRCILGAV